jgi:hypothetical protein
MIKGIYADKADQLHPEQWVNVYHLFLNRAIYQSSCQVKDLDFDEDDADEYGLELIDEDGNLI